MDNNLRIAYITPEAPPFSGGGIATFINNITKGMQQAGIFCEVFTPAINEPGGEDDIHGVTCHRIPTQGLASFRKDVVPYFLHRHQQQEFKIIESCEIHASLVELMKKDIPDVKFVTRVQMPVVYQLWLNNYYESRVKKLRYVAGAAVRGRIDLGFWNKVDVKRHADPEFIVCKNSDAIIAPSVSFKNWLVKFWRLPAQKITVIPHLFDFKTMHATGSKPFPKSEGVHILFVGKLNAHKGVVNLAKAAQNIWKKYPQTTFTMVGEEWPIKYGNAIIGGGALVKRLVNNDPRLILTGKINYKELDQYYDQADICIFPSIWEAWGYTCSEAMSFGKAVIGSKYGGMADAINDGENGLLVDPHDVSDLEKKMEKLITDPDLRKQLGAASRRTIESKLGFEKLVQQNLDFYHSILSKKHLPHAKALKA